MDKLAMITGITGQSGSIMAKLLLSKGYYVVGLKRRLSSICTDRVDDIYDNPNFKMEYFDLNDAACMYRLLNKYKPDELYHFAALSHVRVSFDISEDTVSNIVLGTLRLLNALKEISPKTKFYNAASSEIFGDAIAPSGGFAESSTKNPVSPYACAKLAAHHLVENYRNSYDLFLCSGILFNHCSNVRGETFVTRKITKAVARIKLGLQDKLMLGNIDAFRDWGWAEDYMEACYLMLQQPDPDTYVIATGESHSVREFLKEAFYYTGLGDFESYVDFDDRYLRPQEVPFLLGNANKAKTQLKWKPRKSFKDIVHTMIDNDIEQEQRSK